MFVPAHRQQMSMSVLHALLAAGSGLKVQLKCQQYQQQIFSRCAGTLPTLRAWQHALCLIQAPQ